MKKRKGFTLIETVISVVLIGVVASFTFSAMHNSQTYIIRSKVYAEVVYKALEDVNRGVEVNETTPKYIRRTTVTEEGNLKIVKSIVTSNLGEIDTVEAIFVRYKK